ncbi:MAG: low molecular weight phosphotyrosine protein phosphatase [Porphyromonadaceae bacterium]|nr:low molecular weight phosphotyrosine protein phosphatase [Porphyromonadaceae bacterium]
MSKKSVLFVCLGNICRSPMAQTVFEKIISEKGVDDKFIVDSAGLIDYHEGNKADSRMRAHAEKRGYEITHRSRPVRKSDFDKFDYIVAMDNQNIRGLNSIATTDEHRDKILRMTDYLQKQQADYVPDPYYGGPEGFELVIDLLEDACEGLFKEINK